MVVRGLIQLLWLMVVLLSRRIHNSIDHQYMSRTSNAGRKTNGIEETLCKWISELIDKINYLCEAFEPHQVCGNHILT